MVFGAPNNPLRRYSNSAEPISYKETLRQQRLRERSGLSDRANGRTGDPNSLGNIGQTSRVATTFSASNGAISRNTGINAPTNANTDQTASLPQLRTNSVTPRQFQAARASGFSTGDVFGAIGLDDTSRIDLQNFLGLSKDRQLLSSITAYNPITERARYYASAGINKVEDDISQYQSDLIDIQTRKSEAINEVTFGNPYSTSSFRDKELAKINRDFEAQERSISGKIANRQSYLDNLISRVDTQVSDGATFSKNQRQAYRDRIDASENIIQDITNEIRQSGVSRLINDISERTKIVTPSGNIFENTIDGFVKTDNPSGLEGQELVAVLNRVIDDAGTQREAYNNAVEISLRAGADVNGSEITSLVNSKDISDDYTKYVIENLNLKNLYERKKEGDDYIVELKDRSFNFDKEKRFDKRIDNLLDDIPTKDFFIAGYKIEGQRLDEFRSFVENIENNDVYKELLKRVFIKDINFSSADKSEKRRLLDEAQKEAIGVLNNI